MTRTRTYSSGRGILPGSIFNPNATVRSQIDRTIENGLPTTSEVSRFSPFFCYLFQLCRSRSEIRIPFPSYSFRRGTGCCRFREHQSRSIFGVVIRRAFLAQSRLGAIAVPGHVIRPSPRSHGLAETTAALFRFAILQLPLRDVESRSCPEAGNVLWVQPHNPLRWRHVHLSTWKGSGPAISIVAFDILPLTSASSR